MQKILKTAILIVLFTLVFSFFGSYLTIAFTSMSAALNYATTPTGVGLVLSSIWTFLSWAFDLIFLNTEMTYVNSVLPASIHIGSISWALTFFRLLFGCTLIVFIISLIFGGKNV